MPELPLPLGQFVSLDIASHLWGAGVQTSLVGTLETALSLKDLEGGHRIPDLVAVLCGQ